MGKRAVYHHGVRAVFIVALLLLTAACSEDAEVPPPVEQPPDPPVECEPGELLLPDDSCLRVGSTEMDCADGFVLDGDGCAAVLPDDPCPHGQMAVPGETSCRAVAPCGAAPWGDIPVEPNTQYVDQSYVGGGNDGSAGKPWTTISDAVAAAESGAIVAIAAGSYPAAVVLQRPVRLWGRCPALVELVGQPGEVQAIGIWTAAARGTEIRDLAITGNGVGVLMAGAVDVLLDRVWIHDNTSRGVSAEQGGGPTSVTVSKSLIEEARDTGVMAFGVSATVDQSVVRGIIPLGGDFGRGVTAQTIDTNLPAEVTIRGSVLEANHEIDALAIGSTLNIEGTVIRREQVVAQRAISIETNNQSAIPSSATVRSVLVDGARGLGMLVVGSDADVRALWIRNTKPDLQGLRGVGLIVQYDRVTGLGGSATVSASVISDVLEAGISVSGADLILDGSVVRDVASDAQGGFGRGITAAPSSDGNANSSLTVQRSLVERVHQVGISFDGTATTIDSSVVRDVEGSAGGLFGRGISGQYAPVTLALSNSIVERVHEFGVLMLGGPAILKGVRAVDVAPNGEGAFGDGVTVAWQLAEASAVIEDVVSGNNARAGLSNFGAHVDLSNTTLQCNTFDLEGEVFNGSDFRFNDLGGNRCGCEELSDACAVVSNGIAGPSPP